MLRWPPEPERAYQKKYVLPVKASAGIKMGCLGWDWAGGAVFRITAGGEPLAAGAAGLRYPREAAAMASTAAEMMTIPRVRLASSMAWSMFA